MFLLILEKGRERERETSLWERNIDWLPPVPALIGDWTHNLGTCPDWESSPQPFGVRDDAPANWTTQAGLECEFIEAFFDAVFLFWMKCKYHINSRWKLGLQSYKVRRENTTNVSFKDRCFGHRRVVIENREGLSVWAANEPHIEILYFT